jgi:folate-binding protein YgfZ
MLEFSSMPELTPTSPAGYIGATQQAAFYPVPDPGYIQFSGETRRDYIQRQTTNDIDLLSPTSALPNLLTSPTGRILEYFTLLEIDGSIAMLTQPGHGPGLAAYFQKRIFFNDQVIVQGQSADWSQLELLGPKAAELLAQFYFLTTPVLDEVVVSNWKGHNLRAIGQLGFDANPRFRVLFPSVAKKLLLAQLTNTPTLSFASREILRIESSHAGDPEFAAETTPFELGMDRLVSTTKGCYTGQEVLARQVTYDKVVRRLIRLQADQPMMAGASLSADGKSIGQVTSATISPRMGPVALGVVRKPYDAANTEMLVVNEGKQINAKVTQ